MVQVSDDSLEEFIELSKKEGVEYKDRSKAREAANNMVNLVDILFQIDQQERGRKKRLETEPKGFTFPGEGRGCSLCHHMVSGDMWYDKWGQQCLDCHEAYKKRLVPGFVFKDHKHEKSVTGSILESKYGVKHMTLKKLVRQGKLKARVIPGNGVMVFLRKENPDIVDIIEKDKKEREKK